MYFVYILASQNNHTVYIGVSNNLERRLYEHRSMKGSRFTNKYHVIKLVYFEQTTDIQSAISREKQLKGWSRAKKNELIQSVNPDWTELFDEEGLHLP